MKVSCTFLRSLLILLGSLFLFPSILAQSSVSGTVIDNFGDPVVGASVVEKGTGNGIMTDFDGKFTLKLKNDKSKLSVSYVGMVTKEVVATPGTPMKIELEENNSVLDDVVVLDDDHGIAMGEEDFLEILLDEALLIGFLAKAKDELSAIAKPFLAVGDFGAGIGRRDGLGGRGGLAFALDEFATDRGIHAFEDLY